jgi:hypothetical protein
MMDRRPAGNTSLAKLADQCSADSFVVDKALVLRINICYKNRHLRQARKRYHLLRKNPCTERFGDFLFSITTRKDYFRWEKCAQQRGSKTYTERSELSKTKLETRNLDLSCKKQRNKIKLTHTYIKEARKYKIGKII